MPENMEKRDLGWITSKLECIGKSGEDVILKCDAGIMPTKWKKLDGTASGKNLVAICKGLESKWHIEWFADANGVRHILEILNDRQYAALQTVTNVRYRNLI